jgi:hypothetical protein
MRYTILLIASVLLSLTTYAQSTHYVFPAVGGPNDFWHTGGMLTSDVQMRVPYQDTTIQFYKKDGSMRYDTVRKLLFAHNGITWQRVVDSTYLAEVAASIEAGTVDSSIYSTVTRLADSLYRLRIYVDSLNTVLSAKQGADSLLFAQQIAAANLNIAALDSALVEAFGAIIDLYENKADKDTLNNFVLHAYLDSTLGSYADTGLLALKQNYSDTLTFDATRHWVSTQIPSLAGYVPYTGATTNLDLGPHTISARTGVINKSSGSGTALSVTKGGAGEALTVTKTSGAGNAMSVTGGITLLETLHTTNPIADAYIASAATWNAKGNGSVTSIQLVGGTGVTITPTTAITTSGTYTISATGGGGGAAVAATTGQVLYKSGTDTTIRGAAKAGIDTTDGRLVFPNDTTTTDVLPYYGGGIKVWGNNSTGIGCVKISDTFTMPSELQRAVSLQNTSTLFPVFSANTATAGSSGAFTFGGLLQTFFTAYSFVPSTYNSTIQQINYNKGRYTTGTGANASALIRVGSLEQGVGLLCGDSRWNGGAGKGTFTFCLPVYAAGEAIFFGYSRINSNVSSEPSTFLTANPSIPCLGVGKDAADNTFHFFHNSIGVFTAPTKVNIGVTPNPNDVYRVTVYVTGASIFYIKFEVITKTGITTYICNPTTNIPPIGTRLSPFMYINNIATTTAISWGLISVTEETY